MSDNLIVKIHLRTLWPIYDTQTRPYEELLHLSRKKKIHTKNLQIHGLNTTLIKVELLWNKPTNHLNKKQNPLYISKINFGNGKGGHVLVVSALKLCPFKKCTYVKKTFKSVLIYLYF